MIIFIYILKKLVKTFLLVSLLIVLIFALFHFLEELDNEYPISEKFNYIIFSLPYIFNILSPLSLLIASLITLGRITSSRELLIIFSSGISSLKFFKIFFTTIITFSVILVITSEFYSPFFSEEAQKIKTIASGRTFNNENENIWLKIDNKFIKIDSSIDGKELYGLKLIEIDDSSELNSIKYSDRAKLIKNSLLIENPVTYEITEISNLFSINENHMSEEELVMQFDEIRPLKKDETTMSIIQLIDAIWFSKISGLDNNFYILEVFSRLTRPLVLVSLLSITLPLVINFQRSASLGTLMLIAISISLLFSLLTKLMNVFSLNFGLSIYFAILIPLFIISIAGAYSLARLQKFR